MALSSVALLVVVPVGALLVWLLASARRAGDRPGPEVTVRCWAGHVFTTGWEPVGPSGMVMPGQIRLRYCPVGEHWTVVTPVRREDLTFAEHWSARHFHDEPVR